MFAQALSATAVALACALAAPPAAASEPVLTVVAAGQTATHTPGELLGLPATVTVTIPNDASYRRAMTYRAIPMAALLPGVPPSASVRFTAADGFAATMAASQLLAADDKGARAYLAIEPADAPWPPLRAGDPASAGPFYLVWVRPERSRIVPEQWPYRIAKIEQIAPLAVRFPQIVPAATVAAKSPIHRGFAVFTKHCIVCHTLNLGGDSTIGPDLNVPFNPTEYLRADALRRLIRDPQSLRRWSGTRMSAFDTATLSDRELNDLSDYLRHMANRKVPIPPLK
jgi:mono/diheme cytochrome c family protein